MAASSTDKFRLASGTTRPVPTTLALPKANGSNTATLTTATGWNTTTGVDVVIYRRELDQTSGTYVKVEGTQTEWVAELTGVTLANMILNAGTEPAAGYAADGNTVVYCAPTSQWGDDLINGILEFANQNATLKASAIQAALGIGSSGNTGFQPVPADFTYTGNSGRKEFTGSFNADVTSYLPLGAKLLLNRSAPAPTQCADFESTSSQYAAKSSPTGITFLDDFSVEAWIKLESYLTTPQTILSRRVGIVAGWQLRIMDNGRVSLIGATNGTTFRDLISYQSVPVGQWVHIAATLDISGNAGTVYINGELVPSTISTTGTPSALVQGGDLIIGNYTSGNEYFDGQISEVRLWSTIRTQQQIRDNMAIQIATPTSATGLIGYWKLDGNFTDSSTNANTLVASGGAIPTFADNPYHTTEYAIVTKVGPFSTGTTPVTLFTGTDYVIPNATLTGPQYSRERTPVGFPSDANKWVSENIYFRNENVGLGATQWLNWLTVGGNSYAYLRVPTGAWDLGYSGSLFISRGSGNSGYYAATLSTATNTEGDRRMIAGGLHSSNVSSIAQLTPIKVSDSITVSTPTIYYLNVWSEVGGASVGFGGPGFITKITARCPYV